MHAQDFYSATIIMLKISVDGHYLAKSLHKSNFRLKEFKKWTWEDTEKAYGGNKSRKSQFCSRNLKAGTDFVKKRLPGVPESMADSRMCGSTHVEREVKIW